MVNFSFDTNVSPEVRNMLSNYEDKIAGTQEVLNKILKSVGQKKVLKLY